MPTINPLDGQEHRFVNPPTPTTYIPEHVGIEELRFEGNQWHNRGVYWFVVDPSRSAPYGPFQSETEARTWAELWYRGIFDAE